MKARTYKKHFYTFPNVEINYHGLVTIKFDGKINWVNGTPIEDYGDWLLLDDYVEPEKAFEIWLES